MHYQIIVNSVPISVGSSLPTTIHSLQITCFPGIAVPLEHVLPLKQWLNELVDRVTCDYVSYNGVLIPSSELHKF